MISAGAPAATNSCLTFKPLNPGSLTWLYNFPSENVPAPPSPNCTFDSVFNSLVRQKRKVSLARSWTDFPRSKIIGLKPICANISPTNKPHGPMPITNGRSVKPSGAVATYL